MGKSHRDNARARKKIGQVAYQKKAKHRSKPNYIGPWTVTFKCQKAVYVSQAASSDIMAVASRLHDEAPTQCKLQGCHPIKFVQER